jgi:diaminopimelate decarboxylase
VRPDAFVRNRRFEVEGLGLAELERLSGTPFYVYSGRIVRQNYQKLIQSLPGFEVFFSLKANPLPAISSLLRSLGACAEVSSVGELRIALRAGFAPHSIIFVGPAKTRRDLGAALDSGVYAVVAESAAELALLEELAARRRVRPAVLLRVNTLEQPTGAREVMVGGASKFGFDEETLVSDVRKLTLSHVRLLGIQAYSASGVLDAGFIGRHLEYLVRLAVRVSRELDFPLRCIDFGGGFGIPYESGQRALDLARVSRAAARLRRNHAQELRGCRLILEIGRYLTAESGVFVTRVVRVKESRGRFFAICDGGMNHFSRPVFMRVAHQARDLNRIVERPVREYEIAGPLCTPIDRLATKCRLPKVEAGDLIGVFDAGAYGFSMSLLRFLSFGKPGEILIDQGRPVCIRRRAQ